MKKAGTTSTQLVPPALKRKFISVSAAKQAIHLGNLPKILQPGEECLALDRKNRACILKNTGSVPLHISEDWHAKTLKDGDVGSLQSTMFD